jgi:glyoxylase-like metal-dependent hydrolase (beta-lactamase superfamily II)
MRIHALKTGSMTVKSNYYHAKGGSRLARLSSALMDSQFMDIPVYVWVIEHPEGIIVVDMGQCAKFTRPEYFPLWQRPYWVSQYRFNIRHDEEIGAQLSRLGLPAQEVRWVLLTHTHFDHTGPMNQFPNAEFILSRKENDDLYRYRSAHFGFPGKWPYWLKKRIIDHHSDPLGSFTHSYPVTEAGDVWLVPTPGHTMGHQSVIVKDAELTYFLAGDTSFDQASLLNGTIDAPAANTLKDFETRQRILDYADAAPLVYLTTHDPETPYRLENHATLRQQPVAVGYEPA